MVDNVTDESVIDSKINDCRFEIESSAEWLGKWWMDTDAFLKHWLGEDINDEVRAKGHDGAVRDLLDTVRSINAHAKAELLVLEDIKAGRTKSPLRGIKWLLQMETLVNRKLQMFSDEL